MPNHEPRGGCLTYNERCAQAPRPRADESAEGAAYAESTVCADPNFLLVSLCYDPNLVQLLETEAHPPGLLSTTPKQIL